MLSNAKLIISGFLTAGIYLISCSQPEKPESYVARVNDAYLTESELNDLLESQFVSEKSRNTIIKNWVKQEVLFQEAVKKGLTETSGFNRTLENTKRQLAAALVLNNFVSSYNPVFSEADLLKYYNENKTSFRLPLNSFFINRIEFSDRESAIRFRSELILNGWSQALSKFTGDLSVVKISSEVLLPENDVYPLRLLRILEELYPLEISIVIPDDRGYYSVVQLLDKYAAQSIPPFKAVRSEAERRYKAALTELALENYLSELYSLSKIETTR